MKTTAVLVALSLALSTTAFAQQAEPPTVTDTPPAQPSESEAQPECRNIRTGGPIAGIVVASVFWWVLPMSIPVWITQAKKLKRRKAEIYEQTKRGCPPP